MLGRLWGVKDSNRVVCSKEKPREAAPGSRGGSARSARPKGGCRQRHREAAHRWRTVVKKEQAVGSGECLLSVFRGW